MLFCVCAILLEKHIRDEERRQSLRLVHANMPRRCYNACARSGTSLTKTENKTKRALHVGKRSLLCLYGAPCVRCWERLFVSLTWRYARTMLRCGSEAVSLIRLLVLHSKLISWIGSARGVELCLCFCSQQCWRDKKNGELLVSCWKFALLLCQKFRCLDETSYIFAHLKRLKQWQIYESL